MHSFASEWRSYGLIIGNALAVALLVVAGCQSDSPAGSGAAAAGSGASTSENAAEAMLPTVEDVTVEISVEGQGNVSQIATGNVVTLEAAPDEGWVFDRWLGIPSTANPVVIIADESTAVGARFVPAPIPDEDTDGVDDRVDACLDTPHGATVDEAGCAAAQLDSDADEVSDDVDQCPETAAELAVNALGCATNQLDDDDDGVTNDVDLCPSSAANADVDSVGCAPNQLDTDQDGVLDSLDACPDTAAGVAVGLNGCPAAGGQMPAPAPPPPPGGGGPAVCGNGVIESGEGCEPPGSLTCSATCQPITGPPPVVPPNNPPPAGPTPATWTSTQFLFGGGPGGGYMTPESYDLSASGTLITAHLTPNADDLLDIFGAGLGAIGSLATTVPLGQNTELFEITGSGPPLVFTVNVTATISAFSLAINAGTATWTFNYTIFESDVFPAPLGTYMTTAVLAGSQTGTVSADGSQITWTSVNGTATVTDENSEVLFNGPLAGPDYVLGAWNKTGN